MAVSNSSGVKSAFSAAGLSGGGQATVLDFNEAIDLPLDAYLPTSKTKFQAQGALGKTTPPSIKTNHITVKEIGQACFQREKAIFVRPHRHVHCCHATLL